MREVLAIFSILAQVKIALKGIVLPQVGESLILLHEETNWKCAEVHVYDLLLTRG